MNLYRIRELRQARAWSQEQLAELCSLNVRTIQRIENGEQASLETLGAIAAVMDLKVSELYSSDASQQQDAPANAVTNVCWMPAMRLKMKWLLCANYCGQ